MPLIPDLTEFCVLLSLCLLAVLSLSATAEGPEVVFPDEQWAQKAPEELGMDREKLQRLARRVRGAGCIIKDGYLVYSWGNQTKKFNWASAAKPVISTMLFFAVHEGRLSSVNDRVGQWGWKLEGRDGDMTFYHLANMTSGYAMPDAPGEAYSYNDFAIKLYVLTMERVFGKGLNAAAMEYLKPLQLQDGTLFDSHGRVVTTPRDFARIGWFWLKKGNWKGRQLLPRRFFQQYMRPHVPADLPRSKGHSRKPNDYLHIGSYGGGTNQTPYGPGVYGFNWWFNAPIDAEGRRFWPDAPPDAFQANGLWGRYVVAVFPSLKLVAAAGGGNWGKFEPGESDSRLNRALKLLTDSVRSPAGPETVAGGRETAISGDR